MGFIYNWTRMSGAPANNDLIMLIDVSDKTDSSEGTNKLLEADYVVYDPSAGAATVTNGGNIQLDGHALTIAGSGTLDLNTNTIDVGGNVTTDGALSIAGAVITFGGQSLTIGGTGSLQLGTHTLTVSSPSTLDLSSQTLSLSTGDLAFVAPVAGATITLSGDGTLALGGNTLTLSSDATLNMGGFTLATDGNVTFAGTAITLGGQTYDLANFSEATPGLDNRLAAWVAGKLVAANVAQLGVGIITLSAATDQTLTIASGGTLALESNTLTVNSGGALTLGGFTLVMLSDGTLDLKGNSVTVQGNLSFPTAGTLNLNSQVLNILGSGDLDLAGVELEVRGGDTFLNDGGVLNLGGFTATLAKGGTFAMTDDLGTHWGSPGGPFGPYFSLYSNPDNGHNPNAWTDYDAGFIWLGSVYGSQSAKLAFGGRVTGTGTGHIRVVARSTDTELTALTIPNNGGAYQVLTIDTTLPAADESYYFQAYTSTSGTYIYCTDTAVICA